MKRPTTNQPDYMGLLDGDVLARIHRLELTARGMVAGSVSGRHRSPYKGFSAEFAEHREYAVGDDVRLLDWKVFGRSDRYTIKQFADQTNLRCLLLVDASGSMGYTGDAAARVDGRRLSKFAYAQRLAATLAHLLLGQADAVGLATFDTRVRTYVPARGRRTHLRAILQELHGTETGGETTLAPIFHDLAERIHRRRLVIILSDLFDDAEALLEALHHFRYRRHEVLLLHVMAAEEAAFPFDRRTNFRDLELPGHRVRVDPAAMRAAYLEALADHIARIRTGTGRMRIDYVQLSTAQPYDQALAGFLARRMRTC